jgi:hypothetical protein
MISRTRVKLRAVSGRFVYVWRYPHSILLTSCCIPPSALMSIFSPLQDSSEMLSGLTSIGYLACASACFYFALNVGIQARWPCMPFLIFFAVLSVLNSHHLSWPQGLSDLWGLSVVIWTIHIVSLLFCECPLEIRRKTDIQATPESTTRWRLRPAYKLLFNLRLLRAQREDSENRLDDRVLQQPQNRYKFCVTKSCRLVIIWLLHTRIEPLIYPGPFLPFKPSDFSPARQVFLRRLLLDTGSITPRETGIRACLAVRWIWIAIYEIEAAHAFLAIVFVTVLRFDTAEEWPTLFGSITEAYSLRSFWGRFWHRIANRSYTNFGRLVSRRGFGFRPSTMSDKVTGILVVFLVSGLAHSLVSWCSGDKRHYMLDTYFFLLNFLGGVLEVTLSQLLDMMLGSTDRAHFIPMRRMIGYCWIFCFFFCVVPKWQYPRAYEQLQYVERMKALWDLLSVDTR